ncbi:MAG: ankyrin repeat domain-containing protein [Spirochaetes bacterium]|nr:ankyrin repeat domain-containing protein [Spirochaetota bacterium]
MSYKKIFTLSVFLILNVYFFPDQQEFLKAVKSGDVKKTKTFLNQDKNPVNMKDELKEYPLYFAVKKNNVTFTLLLTKYVTKADIKDKTNKIGYLCAN